MLREVERYRKPTRILHWIHAGAFIVLLLTGLVLFLPAPISLLAQDSWTRLIHRIAAVIFVAIPLWYIVTNWKATVKSVREAFTWGAEDLGWLQAAPRYYFLGEEEAMPAQGHMNTGQKMWWLMVIVFSAVFVITGFIMWFAKTTAPPTFLQWMVFAHDVAFITTGTMFFVHVYLSILHPLMTEAWNSMARGKVSVEYAQKHHGKWLEEMSREKEVR